jgi:branched-chain amino acid transport system permease protein
MSRLLPFAPLLLLLGGSFALIPGTEWVTLTLSGLSLGAIVFLAAVGLSLIFGLMGVLNFAHGSFVTLGAFLTALLLGRDGPASLGSLGLALAAAAGGGAVSGGVVERLFVRPVLGAPLRQILMTLGAGLLLTQTLIGLFGADPLPLPRPAALQHMLFLGGSPVDPFRLAVIGLGGAVMLFFHLLGRMTRIGLFLRAAVEDREMVDALGVETRHLFRAVFITGAALAGLGGGVYALHTGMVTAELGDDILILAFITVIIGGIGSVEGCFLGALLAGLTFDYAAFLWPKLALGSDILLLLLILLWRPRGLLGRDG